MELALRGGRRDVGDLRTCAAGAQAGASGNDCQRTFTKCGEGVVIVVGREGVDVVPSEPRPFLSLLRRDSWGFDVTTA